jgi:hypothetical protein
MEAWIPVLTLVIGYVLQPAIGGIGTIISDRRAKDARRWSFQFDTLTGLTDAMETWRNTAPFIGGNPPMQEKQVAAKERVRALTFRVKDDELRQRLEAVLAAPANDAFFDKHGDAVRRLGEVLRDL